MKEEIWKDIFGGDYSVSSHGRVRSNPKVRKVRAGGTRTSKSKMLKLSINQYGYLRVNFSRHGGTQLLHRVVAKAFIPNPQNLETVNHKDFNKTNNHIENLEWSSNGDNVRHAWNGGRFEKVKRKVRCIETGLEFETLRDAAKHVGLKSSGNLVSHLQGKQPTYGGYTWEYVSR